MADSHTEPSEAVLPLRITPEQRLGFIAQQVAQMRTMVTNVRPALPGSSLSVDDLIYPPYTPSQVVWQGLCSAVDHIDLFVSALAATKTGYPSAYFTLARAAIVGAAHALWVLDADRLERQRRALRLVHEDYRQERSMFTDMVRLMPPDPDNGWDKRIDSLTLRMRSVQAAGAPLGMDPDKGFGVPDGQIIEAMARRHVAAADDDADLIVAGYVSMWRQHSGSAHGLRWSLLLRSMPAAGESEGHVRVASGGVEEISHAAAQVYLFVRRAFELYELRRLPHVA